MIWSDEPGVAVALLRYLRRMLGYPDLEYEDRLAPIALGTEAWILGFSLRPIAAYERYRPIDHERILYFETDFLVSVLVDMTDRYMRRTTGQAVPGNLLLDDPSTPQLVRANLEVVLGIRVPTPEEAAA